MEMDLERNNPGNKNHKYPQDHHAVACPGAAFLAFSSRGLANVNKHRLSVLKKAYGSEFVPDRILPGSVLIIGRSD